VRGPQKRRAHVLSTLRRASGHIDDGLPDRRLIQLRELQPAPQDPNQGIGWRRARWATHDRKQPRRDTDGPVHALRWLDPDGEDRLWHEHISLQNVPQSTAALASSADQRSSHRSLVAVA